MATERKDIVIFGNGPSDLSSTLELSKQGNNIEVITSEQPRLPHSVYTTNKLLPVDLAEKFFSTNFIKKIPYLRVITTNGTDFRMNIKSGKYFMVNYPSSLDFLQKSLSKEKNIKFSQFPQKILNNIHVTDSENGVSVSLDGQRKKYSLAIDATGNQAEIDKIVNPNHENNFLSEYIYGATFRGSLDYNEMILVIGPAGGTCWVSSSIEGDDFVDVVFSAYGPKKYFNSFIQNAEFRLNELKKFVINKPGIEIYSTNPVYKYSGLIRSQPTKPPITFNVYAVGEAAGMAKPGTGDSIQRAIKSGRLLAESLNEKQKPKDFYKKWRRLWQSDKFIFAATLARLPYQERGDLGKTFDIEGKIIKNEDKENAEKLIAKFEKYIVEGKLDYSLFIKLLSTKEFSSMISISMIKELELIFKRKILPDKLPLPKIN